MFAWNPLVLFDLVGGSHNDVAMLALLLVGIAVLARWPANDGWLGLSAMTLGALVKYASGLAVLVWAVGWSAQATGLRQRAIRLAAGLGPPLALSIVLGWPWLQPIQALVPLGNAASGRLVINSAPQLLALTVADQVLVPAGWEPRTAQMAAQFWMRALTAGLFVGVPGMGGYHTCGRSPCAAAGPRLRRRLLPRRGRCSCLPLLVLTWVWSWYFSWSLVLAALLGWQSRLARVVVAYTLVAVPVVTAHQYLGEQLSGGFIELFALGPLSRCCAPPRGEVSQSGSQRPTAQPQPVPAGER